MNEPLNVIALISGGKDSFFSILHCIKNGHKVVALGNLYPGPQRESDAEGGASAGGGGRREVGGKEEEEEEEHDLNSFMYQTVGHTVIPLYEEALGIPLYRQQIVGTAVQTGTSYSHAGGTSGSPDDASWASSRRPPHSDGEDETESLVPLLKTIMKEHPSANALSTGAILSTYQRTRIESVALRLGLTPLSYLWKYPVLPPGTQTSLLQDMEAVGLEARIVKVSSGGLDEGFLWEDIASGQVVRRVERSMRRFGTLGDGGVLGEGGEFETLVVDGPRSLFKGRIEVGEDDRRIVREGGGAAWLRIVKAKVVMREPAAEEWECRSPALLEERFSNVLNVLGANKPVHAPNITAQSISLYSLDAMGDVQTESSNQEFSRDKTLYWTVCGRRGDFKSNISDEAKEAMIQIRQLLQRSSLEPSAIVSTMIILRSMEDFAPFNKVYGALFTKPNPPARVTISCGEAMPKDTNIIIHLKIDQRAPLATLRKALHVQSRSYWAPANIGPYSQATSMPIESNHEPLALAMSIAGQIPLIPSSMDLPSGNEAFELQTVLALQHLWRIGEEVEVRWWTSAVAYLPRGTAEEVSRRAAIAGRAWREIHTRALDDADPADEPGRDLWEEKHYAGKEQLGADEPRRVLPDWTAVRADVDAAETDFPPFFAVEIEALPRSSLVEWHAHLGVVNASVRLRSRGKDGCWTAYQCSFGNAIQSAIMISTADKLEEIEVRAREAADALGIPAGRASYLAYFDVTMEGLEHNFELELFRGFVPCRSVLDINGKKLAAVLLFDTEPQT